MKRIGTKHFRLGKQITNLDDMINERFIFWLAGGIKPILVPFGWFQNWQFRYVANQIKFKRVFFAIPEGGAK